MRRRPWLAALVIVALWFAGQTIAGEQAWIDANQEEEP